jgi:hypothetical protein
MKKEMGPALYKHVMGDHGRYPIGAKHADSGSAPRYGERSTPTATLRSACVQVFRQRISIADRPGTRD